MALGIRPLQFLQLPHRTLAGFDLLRVDGPDYQVCPLWLLLLDLRLPFDRGCNFRHLVIGDQAPRYFLDRDALHYILPLANANVHRVDRSELCHEVCELLFIRRLRAL